MRFLRRVISLFLAVFSVCSTFALFCVGADASESRTTVEGLEYFVTENNTVTITGWSGDKTEVIIPKEIEGLAVTQIGMNAFFEKEIISISIPEGVTDIGACAFSDCENLLKIELPDSVSGIGWYAFRNCGSLSEIFLPENLTWLGGAAFANCRALTAINIPKGLTYLDELTFSGCTGLKSIDVPEGVTQIRASVFSGCEGLTTVHLPESLNSFGDNAFHGCMSLTELTLPGSASYIGTHCFCKSGLKLVRYSGTEEEWDKLIQYSREEYYFPYDDVRWCNEVLLNAEIIFLSPAYGDIDGDSIITSDDAVYLLNYTLFPEIYPLNCSADFDRDELLTSDDAVYLLNYTLFPNLYPLEEQKP